MVHIDHGKHLHKKALLFVFSGAGWGSDKTHTIGVKNIAWVFVLLLLYIWFFEREGIHGGNGLGIAFWFNA